MQRRRPFEQVADEINIVGLLPKVATNPLKSEYFLRWIIPMIRALTIDALSLNHDGVWKLGNNGIAVLVVEDETLVRLNIVLALEDEGFAVYEASDADEAIEDLNTHFEIRLLFTDIDMPGSMDGLKLAAAVRDRWPPIRIIVTSGHRHLSDELLPVEGRFFAKPYDMSIVIGAMRDMLGPS